MPSSLEYDVTSMEFHIKNDEKVSIEQRKKYFDDHMVFKPLGIEFDEENQHYLLIVDFTKAE